MRMQLNVDISNRVYRYWRIYSWRSCKWTRCPWVTRQTKKPHRRPPSQVFGIPLLAHDADFKWLGLMWKVRISCKRIAVTSFHSWSMANDAMPLLFHVTYFRMLRLYFILILYVHIDFGWRKGHPTLWIIRQVLDAVPKSVFGPIPFVDSELQPQTSILTAYPPLSCPRNPLVSSIMNSFIGATGCAYSLCDYGDVFCKKSVKYSGLRP